MVQAVCIAAGFDLPRAPVCRVQLLYLVKRFDEGNAFLCEEWCEVVSGNLPMWLMVKNYLLQYILLEATYLRSTCCIMGEERGGVPVGCWSTCCWRPYACCILVGAAFPSCAQISAATYFCCSCLG
jgi:hypothetical protein